MNGDTMTAFRLQRRGAVDLTFNGEKLAQAGTALDHLILQRWTSITVYRTDNGRYVVEQIGHSTWPGENDRPTVDVCDTVEQVRDALTRNNYRTGKTYLTNLARTALEQAAHSDPAFDAILVERV